MDSELDGYVVPRSPVEVNTRFDRTEGRLTWSPGHILPFESAWMVCSKVMAINLLQWRELKKLIEVTVGQLDSRMNPFISGRWVNIAKFAVLLGEPYNRIEKGFLGSLGFPESLAYRAGIRHCPKCADLGYHCSLFNIQALTHCPWHEVPLTSPCHQCTRTVQTSLLHCASGWLACPACGIGIIDIGRPLARDRMCSQQLDDAFARCNQLVKWWRDVRGREPSANDLFGSVLCVADELDELPEKLHLREGCLQSVVSPPEFWPLDLGATPGSVITWTAAGEFETEDKVDKEDIHRRCYRSVRRKIFRTFVRPHRRCLATLTSMSRCAWMCLERDYACTACVAYLAWRHANEGGPEPSIGRYLPGSRDRLPGLPPSCASLSRACISNMLYADYLRLLMELEIEELGENVMIVSASRDSQTFKLFEIRQKFPLPRVVSRQLGAWRAEDAPVVRVAIPDGRALARRAYDRCRRRRDSNEIMDASGSPEFGFGPRNAWKDMKSHNIIFKLKHTQQRVRRHYRIIAA